MRDDAENFVTGAGGMLRRAVPSGIVHRERSPAPYARSISLPAEVDQDASQAKFENGVLTLTLVKKVKTGATRIAIA